MSKVVLVIILLFSFNIIADDKPIEPSAEKGTGPCPKGDSGVKGEPGKSCPVTSGLKMSARKIKHFFNGGKK